MKCPSWTLVKTEHYFKLLPIWWMGKWHLNALIIISSFSPSVSLLLLTCHSYFLPKGFSDGLYVSWIVTTFSVACITNISPPSLTTDQLVAESVTDNTYEQSHEAAGAGALRRTKTLPWQWRSSSTSPPGAWSSLTVNWGEPPPLSSKNFWESSKFS